MLTSVFKGHFVFPADNPSKAVSTWLRFHEVLYVCKSRLEPRVLQTAVTLNKMQLIEQISATLSTTLVQVVFEILNNLSAAEKVTALLVKSGRTKKKKKKGIQVFTGHKAVTGCTQEPGHLCSSRPSAEQVYLASLSCLATVRISLAPLLSSKLARSTPSRSARLWTSPEILWAVTPTRWTRSSTSSKLCHTHTHIDNIKSGN